MPTDAVHRDEGSFIVRPSCRSCWKFLFRYIGRIHSITILHGDIEVQATSIVCYSDENSSGNRTRMFSGGSGSSWSHAINALKLNISKEDPWLTRFDNRHVANRRDQVQKSSVSGKPYLLTLFARLAFVDTNFADDSLQDSDRKGLLRFRLVPKISKDHCDGGAYWCWIKCILINRISIILIICSCIIYPACKLQLGAYILSKRDYLLHLISRTTSTSDRGQCVHENDLSDNNKRLREALDTIELEIGRFGVCSSLPTLSIYEHALISFAPIVFYLYPALILSSKTFIIDHIRYLFDPIGERRRLSKRLNYIVQVLIGSLMLSSGRYLPNVRSDSIPLIQPDGIDHPSAPYINSFIKGIDEGVMNSYERGHNYHLSHGARYFRTLFDYKARRQFIELLRLIVDHRLVRPICFTSAWHINLSALARLSIIIMSSISFFCPFLAHIETVLLEIRSRADARLDLISCKMHRSHIINSDNGTLLLQRYRFMPKITTKDEETYSMCSESIYGVNSGRDVSTHPCTKAYLMFAIETKYYFTIQAIGFIISYITIGLTLAVASTFYCLIYLVGMINKLAWLEQINRQLRYCIDLEQGNARSLKHQSDPIKHLLLRTRASTADLKRDAANYSVYVMTITMINLELFRREYKPFHKTASFLASQMCLYCTISLIFCYVLMNYSIPEYRKHLFFGTTALSLTMNLYVGYSSYISSRVEKLMRNVTQLVSLFPAQDNLPEVGEKEEDRRNLTLISITLWRRYMFSEDETKQNFAPKLFGSYLDYTRLISLNAYTIALFLLLGRPDL